MTKASPRRHHPGRVLQSAARGMAVLELTLFGAFEARLKSGATVILPRKKAQALLAYLALRPGQMHARDTLAALLWGDVPSKRARHSVRQTLLVLRNSLPTAAEAGLAEESDTEGSACLVAEGDAVGLRADAVDVDVAAFERLAADGSPEALERAAALYRGALLEGISVSEPSFEDWLREERYRLNERAVEILAKLLGHYVRADALEHAVRVGLRLLALDPTQQPAHRTLMRLYAKQGRLGAALRQYQICVAALERELGVEPDADTRRLYRELLQTSARSAPASRYRPAPNLSEPETALVGRVTELATLRERLAEAWKRRGAIGIIQGEAGIGKTRLIDALVHQAGGEGGHVLVGRGYESEQVLPLGPWVNAFRPDVVLDLLEGLDPTWRTELGRLFPELTAGRRPLPGGEDYVRLFEAVTRTVQYLASQGPLLIVLEDLHWADDMTLRLLVFLGRRIADWPVLIIGSVRIEETTDAYLLRRTLSQLGRQPRFFSVTLGPLSQAETLTFVQALARAGTDDAAVQRLGDHVWRASEGNAFMIVEMMRMLRGGAIEPVPDDRVTPPGVRELITARLDRLGERARGLAGVGSVIGREFDFALLERAADLGRAETAEGVDELVARRILHVVGERLDFTHERIREVVYAGLLAPARKRLHEATAQALEALHGPDLAPHALALGRHHYASERWEAAHRYLTQAGKTAAARSAHREGAACFEQAIDALRRLPSSPERQEQTIDLCFELRQSCVPLGDHARALAYLRIAEEQAEAIGDRRRLGWPYTYRAHGLHIAGDSRDAIDAAERSLALAATLDDPDLLESSNLYRGQLAHWLGDYARGEALLRRNITVLEPELQRRGLASRHFAGSRAYLAWCLAELGDFSEALVRTDEAVATATAADNAYWLVYACFGAGLVHLRRGAFDEARSSSERAVALCTGRDFTVLWAIPAAILGLAYARLGRFAEGIPLLERAAQLASTLGAPILNFLAEARLLSGRDDEAAAVATRARELAAQREERGWEAWAWWTLGEIAARRADAAGADQAYRRALADADRLRMRPLAAQCHLGLGRLHRRTDETPRATEHLEIARRMFGEMAMAWWLAETAREMATTRL